MFLDWRSDDRWSFVWFCSGLPSKYLVIDDRRVEAMFFAFFCMNVCGRSSIHGLVGDLLLCLDGPQRNGV